jgi:broad specificity phosphatase PhoE
MMTMERKRAPRPVALVAAVLTTFLATAFVPAAASAQSTVVVVVRHAETASGGMGGDPVLSEAGTARAQALADLLKNANVAALYSTQYQRTRLTATPLAEALHLTVNTIQAANPMQAHIDAIAAKVKEHAGKTVVVVGHSNTVPMIIRALGGPDIGVIPETEYDNLFTIISDASGVRLVRSRY